MWIQNYLFKMILFKKYISIKDFLYRYTIIKIGNLHIRLHKIVDKDRTNLYHNHPFNYISIILKGGYTEIYLEDGIEKKFKYGLFDIVKHDNKTYHRIDNIKGDTITLFIAYGKYDWNAINRDDIIEDVVVERYVNDRKMWCKKQNGIWFIGSINKEIAEKETRHSIHQI